MYDMFTKISISRKSLDNKIRENWIKKFVIDLLFLRIIWLHFSRNWTQKVCIFSRNDLQ